MQRALNHMAAPGLDWVHFLDLAAQLGCTGVEFRNDLDGELFGGSAPGDVAALAAARGLRILALAEVKAFNDWSPEKAAEAEALMRIARACGAERVSLIARNDGKRMAKAERQEDLKAAIDGLGPLLEAHGLVGLIEPLGFAACSLRDKADTVGAILDAGAAGRFQIVHDTFHHALAGGGEIFAGMTGIVHVSGVTDPSLSVSDMQDSHRVLVDAHDRLDNLGQLEALRRADYAGPVSFEPFAAEIHALADPRAAYETSFGFLETALEPA
ncbi:TIM barrel protein [Mangrovicoccus sp. HB161399]|uniref:TIM barrel protein n=1 Tax=Mangrovicoccus sp. HB161399 TaxID=2720392 RepID=UPI0015540AB1|nr:TIM barrel protein [Mangrovicoccus sp. HB161399]